MFEIIGKVIAGVILALLGIVLGGIVVKDLWSWFFVTTFGLPELSVATAIGISLTVGWLCKYIKEPDYEVGDDDFWKALATSVGRTLFIWGAGWIIHLFV